MWKFNSGFRKIDNFMKIVEESMSTYKACKSHVDAVQEALNKTFTE